MINFNKEDGVARKEEQADVEDDPNEEDMGDVKLDDGRELHWRMVFEDNDGGVDNKKTFLHDKRWNVYMSERKIL